MRYRFGKLAFGMAICSLCQSGPVFAQYMMHLDPNLYIMATMGFGAGADPCMGGTAMAERKVAEARMPAPGVMQAYFRAAQDGGNKSTAFHLDQTTSWHSAGKTAAGAQIDAQADPLAVPGNVLLPEPLRFYRGGTGATALGQWAVQDAQGQVAGVYTASFTRVRKEWKLHSLRLSRGEEPVEPAAQYCRKPGDVMESRLSSSKSWQESATKQLGEGKAKLAEAIATEARTAAAALAMPRDPGVALSAREARSRLTYWTRQVDQREKNLARADEEAAKVQKDADEIRRLTGPARNAGILRTAAEQPPLSR